MTKSETRLIDVVFSAIGTDRQEVADEMGMSRATVSRVLNGERLSEKTLDKVADVVKAKFKTLVQDVSKAPI